jgi:hypothetical protein
MQISAQEKIAELEQRIVALEKEVKYLKENTIPVVRHRLSDEEIWKRAEEMEKEVDHHTNKIWAAVDHFFKKVF